MRFAVALSVLALFAFIASGKPAPVEPRIVEKVTPLPVALDKDFEFRKTKLFIISNKPSRTSQSGRQSTSSINKKSGNSPGQKTATLQDVPITFERQYRMFGAVTSFVHVAVILDSGGHLLSCSLASNGDAALMRPLAPCVSNQSLKLLASREV